MNNIGFLIMKVSKELKYALTKELAIFDLTPSQWAVLKRLELEDDHVRTAVEIAAKLDFDKPTMSGIVNRLYEKGMIKKEAHPSDKRASVLLLSPEAKELIPTLESVSNRVIDESLRDFTVEERELFSRLLLKMDKTFNREGNL